MLVLTLFKTLFLGTLISVALNAQEVTETYNCHEKYSMCAEKCEELESGVEECIAQCEPQYNQCLQQEESLLQETE